MGKQVNFYMTKSDENDFLRFLQSTGDVCVFKSVTPTPEIVCLDSLPKQGELFWFAMCLWHRNYSPAPILRHVKQQGYYVVEKFESEVIEFQRCGLDEGRLVRGRIWAEMNGWRQDDPVAIIKKSKEFGKWYDRIAAWIKKRSHRDAVGDYVLPDASDFSKKGGALCQAVLANGQALSYGS